MTKKEITSMRISFKTLRELEGLKVHPRETFEQVILRLIKNKVENKQQKDVVN